MKRLFLLAALTSLIVAAASPDLRGAEATNEEDLVKILQSDATPQEKDAACAQLKRIGTAQSIPAIASLLTDAQLSHSARYALEPMPYPEAGRALTDALAKTTGTTRAGIISSLGNRREEHAVPAIAKLLSDADSETVVMSATALGQIAGPEAQKALQTAWKEAGGAPKVHSALTDGMLRCANRSLASGDSAAALAVFKEVYGRKETERVRTAAYRGMILASGRDGLGLMTRAITGSDPAIQLAALQVIHETELPGETKALVGMLRKASPPVQAAIVSGLGQRGDPDAAEGIANLADSPDGQVRLEVLKALGLIGDASVVRLLAEAAASAAGEEQNAARYSLTSLRRGDVTSALLKCLPDAKPPVQSELARALADRSDTAAAPRLVELAGGKNESAAKAAYQGLAAVGGEADVAAMVKLVVGAKNDAARSEAAEALNSVCQRIQSRHGKLNVAALVNGLTGESPEGPIALLPIFSGLIDPQIRSALRAAVSDSNPQIRTAGIRAMCDTMDPELLPDLQKAAKDAPDEGLRTLAIAACVRLTTQEETIKLSNSRKLDVLGQILAMPLKDDQKRLVLSGIAQVPSNAALQLVEPMLNDAAVKAEAQQAVIKIAGALPAKQDAVAAKALTEVRDNSSDATARKEAAAALRRIEARSEYITTWQAAGPYVQEGKECKELFDIAFPPENGDGTDVKWQRLPPSAEAERPGLMDLLKAYGGEQRVAYARTWVHCDQEGPARLEIGSDDGVKVWLNGKLVHANNVLRAMQPGSDKVDVTLNAGWNLLLLKVTQYNRGWEFCARLVKPDGSRLDGLKFAANRETGS